MALAKRGIALQLQKRIDRDVQLRRKTSASREALPKTKTSVEGLPASPPIAVG